MGCSDRDYCQWHARSLDLTLTCFGVFTKPFTKNWNICQTIYKSMQNIQRGITPKPNKFCRSQLQIWLANSPQVLDLSFFYEKLVREGLNWGEIVWCRKVEYRMSRQWDFLCWIPDHQLISLGQQVSALYFFQFKEFVINKYHMFLYTTLK